MATLFLLAALLLLAPCIRDAADNESTHTKSDVAFWLTFCRRLLIISSCFFFKSCVLEWQTKAWLYGDDSILCLYLWPSFCAMIVPCFMVSYLCMWIYAFVEFIWNYGWRWFTVCRHGRGKWGHYLPDALILAESSGFVWFWPVWAYTRLIYPAIKKNKDDAINVTACGWLELLWAALLQAYLGCALYWRWIGCSKDHPYR